MLSKKVGILTFVLIIFSLSVQAANLTEAYQWLNSQAPTDAYSSSWALLALNKVNSGDTFLKYLESQKDQQECWPKGSCKAKDTALASLALNKEGKNIDKSLDWLKSKQDISLSGEWLLQIKTEDSGQCDVTYTPSSTQVTKKINVDKGFITSEKCSTPSTFFNLGNCLEQNLLLTKASLEFEIKCAVSGEISSVYKDAGTYYLNDDVVTGSQAVIKINNGNFGSYEDTLITNWALKELEYGLNSLVYLRKNFKEDVKSNAFLYLLTQKQNYINELINLQKTDKSFGNVFDTSVAVLALEDGQHQIQIDQARQWLDLQQDKDKTWNKNIVDTAIVLYSAYQSDNINLGETKNTDTTSDIEDTTCNEDNICDLGENYISCPNDCETPAEEPEEPEEELPDEEVLEEPKEEKSFGFLGFIFLTILVLALIYIGYKKVLPAIQSRQKTNERPSFILPKVEPKRTEFRGPINLLKPIAKVKTQVKSKVEEDLEKSLREARKLLEK